MAVPKGQRRVQEVVGSDLNTKIKMYRTIMLPVVLYGCETWSSTLREKHRLRVFENRVLRGIFGSKSDGVTGDWHMRSLAWKPDCMRPPARLRHRWKDNIKVDLK
jgi:hypothetical protein